MVVFSFKYEMDGEIFAFQWTSLLKPKAYLKTKITARNLLHINKYNKFELADN